MKESNEGLTGDTEIDKRKSVSSFFSKVFLIILIGGILFVFWFLGIKQKPEHLPNDHIKENKIVKLEFINDVGLMHKIEDERSMVYVKYRNEKGWDNILLPEFKIKNPTLSPDAVFIAYITINEKPRLYVKKLNADTIYTINLRSAADNLIKEFGICEWTEISWSPNSKFIGFYCLQKETDLNYAVIHDLRKSEIIWRDSIYSKSKNRKISWLNDSTFYTSHSDVNSDYTYLKENRLK